MTAPTPAQVAAVDQLLAANHEAGRRLRTDDATAEIWPELGPVTAPIVGGMWFDIVAELVAGRPFTCEHIPTAIDYAVWFPWLPRWLCLPCSWQAIEERATEATCDACRPPDARGRETRKGRRSPISERTDKDQPSPAHRWSIGIPSARSITAAEPAVSPPLLVHIELCAACDTRNRARAG